MASMQQSQIVPVDGPLVERVAALVEQTRAAVATQVNSALTLMHWHVGRMIDVDILSEQRAGYDQEIVATLSPQLTMRLGRGFDKSSLHRMVKFSQVVPDVEIVGALSPQMAVCAATFDETHADDPRARDRSR